MWFDFRDLILCSTSPSCDQLRKGSSAGKRHVSSRSLRFHHLHIFPGMDLKDAFSSWLYLLKDCTKTSRSILRSGIIVRKINTTILSAKLTPYPTQVHRPLPLRTLSNLVHSSQLQIPSFQGTLRLCKDVSKTPLFWSLTTNFPTRVTVFLFFPHLG